MASTAQSFWGEGEREGGGQCEGEEEGEGQGGGHGFLRKFYFHLGMTKDIWVTKKQ